MVALHADIHEGAHARDAAETLFQPDVLAPADYLKGHRRKFPLEPERELVVALIEDAVFCFKKYRDSKREKERALFTDAESWFFSDEREWPLSFLNVCDLLELDPGYLRSGLLKWKGERPTTQEGGEIHAREETGYAYQRRRHSVGRQSERDHRRNARAAARPGPAAARKARAF